MEQEVLELRRELEASLKEAKQSAEEANMANFQNQLLIDMVRAAFFLYLANEGTFLSMVISTVRFYIRSFLQ